jgi:hypothetical protein
MVVFKLQHAMPKPDNIKATILARVKEQTHALVSAAH